MLTNDSNDSLKLYTALHRLGRQLHRCAHRIGHAENRYREQSRLLLLIAENDGVIQRDLAEEMDVRPSSMTEMLTKMEQLGLIERRQDEKDQRVMHIFLTDQGKKAAGESLGATRAMTDALFNALSDEEISQMLALTGKLSAHLNTMDSAGMERGAAGRGFRCGFEGPHGYQAGHHGPAGNRHGDPGEYSDRGRGRHRGHANF